VELYLHSPNTPSWRGAQLKKNTGANLPLPLHKRMLTVCEKYSYDAPTFNFLCVCIQILRYALLYVFQANTIIDK
jgi:hypothetical protein